MVAALMVSGCAPITSCFVGDCLVSTDLGPKPIRLIKPGDFVVSFDLKENQWVRVKVLKTHRSISSRLYKIKAGTSEIVGVTPDHLIYSVDKKTFLPLNEFSSNSVVGVKNENSLQAQPVKSIEKVRFGWRFVYDITVEGPHHNYCVNNMLVHNKMVPYVSTLKITKSQCFVHSNQFEANFLITFDGSELYCRTVATYAFMFSPSTSNQSETIDFGIGTINSTEKKFTHMFHASSFGVNHFSNLLSVKLNSVVLWNTTGDKERPYLTFEPTGQYGVLWEK